MVTQSNLADSTRNSTFSDTESRLHAPVFIAPHYSHQKTCLHRYLDSRFTERFNQEINFAQDPDQYQAWMAEDHLPPYTKHLTLRQPVHRTFYMVSSAIACQRPGQPAFNPDKIISAGFVIRKALISKEAVKKNTADKSLNSEHGHAIWKMTNGEASGWVPATVDSSEPDIYRRLLHKKIIRSQTPEPPYSGEEVHPMQIRQISLEDGTRQTILYGYLPIGGSYTPAIDTEKNNSDITAAEGSILKKLLPWPNLQSIKHQPGVSGKVSDSVNKDFLFSVQWHSADGLLVNKGVSSWRFARLLEYALYTFHIGDQNFAQQNKALLAKFDTLIFFLPDNNDTHKHSANQGFSLANYLTRIFAEDQPPLLQWLEDVKKNSSHNLENNSPVGTLPDMDNAAFGWSLQIDKEDAEEINYLFEQRLQQQLLKTQLDLPLPKFEQSENDLYFVLPFIRIMEACQEQIYWGEASQLFRVAAPFDPMASRPNMIQLPDIKDVKNGIANGISFIAPAKLAETLRQMDPAKGLSEDIQGKDSSPQLGIGWILSFSLPVITLCAMILLMIVISVLNIIFYWIPWVISWIPYPKVTSNSS